MIKKREAVGRNIKDLNSKKKVSQAAVDEASEKLNEIKAQSNERVSTTVLTLILKPSF